MGVQRLRRIAITATAATALALAAAGPAGAKVATKTITVSQNHEVGKVTARCPDGRRATGGGFRVTPEIASPTFAFVKVFRSLKSGQTGWKVAGEENSSSPMEMEIEAYAICSRHAPRTDAAKHTVAVPTDIHGFTTSKARCDRGENVLGGGFSLSTPSSDGMWLDARRLDDRTWRTRIDSDRGVDVTSIAYCADRQAPKVRKASVGVAGRNPGAAVTKRCPRHSKLLGGGYGQPDAVTGFAGNDFSLFEAFGSLPSKGVWVAAGTHNGNTGSHLVSYAYCG